MENLLKLFLIVSVLSSFQACEIFLPEPQPGPDRDPSQPYIPKPVSVAGSYKGIASVTCTEIQFWPDTTIEVTYQEEAFEDWIVVREVNLSERKYTIRRLSYERLSQNETCQVFYDIGNPDEIYELTPEFFWGFEHSDERELEFSIQFFPDRNAIEGSMVQNDVRRYEGMDAFGNIYEYQKKFSYSILATQ